MTVIILIIVLLFINGIILGSLFVNLKHDVISIHLLIKLLKEDQKKHTQDFQLKMTDKIALLDAKLTRILTEIECQKMLSPPEKMKEKVGGKKFPRKVKPQQVVVPLPGASQQT